MLVRVPKESVGGGASVSDVIEEHLQLVVIVKICSDNSSNRGGHGKLLGCYVLGKKVTSLKHMHAFTEAQCMHKFNAFQLFG